MAPKLGIIAGGGPAPGYVISACQAKGRPFFVLALEGFADKSIVEKVPHEWVRLGAGGKGIDLLKAAGVEELVMIGPIKRPSLASLRPDARAAKFIARIGLAALGDDGLLKAGMRELESEGFRFIGVDDILDDLVAAEGPFGRCKPDEQAQVDIEHGIRVAQGLGALDVGQAVVVQQGMVLGVEAIEGTDALLARCGGLRRDGPGGVLVKIKKPGQERRFDLPTVGPTTIENVVAAGLRGIAIEAGGALVMELDTVISSADENGVFIVGVRIPGDIPA